MRKQRRNPRRGPPASDVVPRARGERRNPPRGRRLPTLSAGRGDSPPRARHNKVSIEDSHVASARSRRPTTTQEPDRTALTAIRACLSVWSFPSERTARRASRGDAETGRAGQTARPFPPTDPSAEASVRTRPRHVIAVPPSRHNESCRCRGAAQIEHASTLSGRSPSSVRLPSLCSSPGRKTDPGRCGHGRAAVRARSRAGAEPPSSAARRPRPLRSKIRRGLAHTDQRDAGFGTSRAATPDTKPSSSGIARRQPGVPLRSRTRLALGVGGRLRECVRKPTPRVCPQRHHGGASTTIPPSAAARACPLAAVGLPSVWGQTGGSQRRSSPPVH